MCSRFLCWWNSDSHIDLKDLDQSENSNTQVLVSLRGKHTMEKSPTSEESKPGMLETQINFEDFLSSHSTLVANMEQSGHDAQARRSPTKPSTRFFSPGMATIDLMHITELSLWRSLNPAKVDSDADPLQAITCGPRIVMTSQFRDMPNDLGDGESKFVSFSRQTLIDMDHSKCHLSIDLFWRLDADIVFPLYELAPLCMYRHLQSLTMIGMMQSYQSHIWLVVWLNSNMTDLTLEMEKDGESLDSKEIAEAKSYAIFKPTASDYTKGAKYGTVPEKLPIVNLSLTNFTVNSSSLNSFDEDKLQDVRFHRCVNQGFCLPKSMRGKVKLKITI